MEKTFGVICEGPSDFRILKRVVDVFFKGNDPFVSCYQPKLLPSGKSDYGGWPLNSLIVQPEVQANRDRILFAICIHSIECWLLPLVYDNNRRENANNCLEPLNLAVQRKYKKMVFLNERNKNENNGIKVYDKLVSDWKRKADIVDTAQYNIGFKAFVQSLDQIQEITKIW